MGFSTEKRKINKVFNNSQSNIIKINQHILDNIELDNKIKQKNSNLSIFRIGEELGTDWELFDRGNGQYKSFDIFLGKINTETLPYIVIDVLYRRAGGTGDEMEVTYLPGGLLDQNNYILEIQEDLEAETNIAILHIAILLTSGEGDSNMDFEVKLLARIYNTFKIT